jgi:hypothetical protein
MWSWMEKVCAYTTLSVYQAVPCTCPPGLEEGPNGRELHMARSLRKKIVYVDSKLITKFYSAPIFITPGKSG